MNIFGVLAALCYPIRQLVGWAFVIGDVEAQKRLQSELDFFRRQNDELYQRNEALTHDLHLLTQTKQSLQLTIEKIQQQLCKELEGSGSYIDGSATPTLLDSTVKTLQARISCLTKLFLNYLRTLNLDPRPELVRHFKGIYLTRSAHVNYMLKAWIYEVIFEDFENESFYPRGATLFLDRDERKTKCFEYFQRIIATDSACNNVAVDSVSGVFCKRKLIDFLSLWQKSFTTDGNSAPSRLFNANNTSSLAELEASEPTRKLIGSFVSAANIVWALHKLCLSFEPRADIIRLKPGTELKEEYMDSVVSKEEDTKFSSRVGFMISPGFWLRRSVVKCQIYLEAV